MQWKSFDWQTCPNPISSTTFTAVFCILKLRPLETFRTFLIKDNLSSPNLWISEVTNSTVPPFSDKLMLFHIVTLVSAAVGFYSAGLSVSQRRDIALEYTGLVTEIGSYAEDGAQLLIKNGWLERPPIADDKDVLSNSQ
jgi:hypothetical protein